MVRLTFKVSIGCLMIVLSRHAHHLETLSFTSSAMKTAVVEMNMSPGRVLAYLMLSPSIAFYPVSVTRLMYFRVWLAASFLLLVSEVMMTRCLQRLGYWITALLSLAQITAVEASWN